MVEANNKGVEEEGQKKVRKRINLGVEATGKEIEEALIKVKGGNSNLKTRHRNTQESSTIQEPRNLHTQNKKAEKEISILILDLQLNARKGSCKTVLMIVQGSLLSCSVPV